LPDLPETMVRSNQTVRCDECTSTQTRVEFSYCLLVSRANLPFLLGSAIIIYHNDGICQAERAYEHMKPTNIYLTDRQKESLRVQAEKEGLPVAEIIRRAVDAYLA
jgi:hypothetical protein